MSLLHKDISEKIIKAFYSVYNELGYGFLEKVYENAMVHELNLTGLKVKQQFPIKVYYKETVVGKYFTDILVDNKIILELKTSKIEKAHELQLLNYLKATDIELGLILSFGQEPKFARKILENYLK